MARQAGPGVLSEAAVRAALVDALATRYADHGSPVLVVHEMPLGRGSTRADLVVLTADGLHGVEVKSAADTLQRLPAQAAWYGRVCTTCALAGDPAHVEGARAALPGWWGLSAVDADGVREVRAGAANPGPDPLAQASLLWVPELKAAVAEAGQRGGTAGMERADLAEVLATAAGPDTGRIVRGHLLARPWIDVTGPRGAVRVVRLPAPPKGVARRARVRGKHERRRLRGG